MAAATPAKLPILLPSPEQIDALCVEYNEAELDVEAFEDTLKIGREALAGLKQPLIDLVNKFGGAHGKKSKLLHGIEWELMGTFGTSNVTDPGAVDRLRTVLVESKRTRLLKRLFEMVPRWNLKSTARAEILKPGVDEDVRALFAVCEVTTASTPKLEVRLKK